MSTVQEIQDAIAKLPENQLCELMHWIHSRSDWKVENDPEVLASVERGMRQLETGEVVSLEEAAS
jgi:predicted transcriptional regulator